MHLDGARLMNAVVKLTYLPPNLSMLLIRCLYVCPGAGNASRLCLGWAADFIRRAHRIRKLVGGGMRQIGIVAAAGIHALENHIDRLADDHANALCLAERWHRSKPFMWSQVGRNQYGVITLPDGALMACARTLPHVVFCWAAVPGKSGWSHI